MPSYNQCTEIEYIPKTVATFRNVSFFNHIKTNRAKTFQHATKDVSQLQHKSAK